MAGGGGVGGVRRPAAAQPPLQLPRHPHEVYCTVPYCTTVLYCTVFATLMRWPRLPGYMTPDHDTHLPRPALPPPVDSAQHMVDRGLAPFVVPGEYSIVTREDWIQLSRYNQIQPDNESRLVQASTMYGTRSWPGRASAASGRWRPASRWPRWTVCCPHPAQRVYTGRGRVLGHREAPHLPRGALRLHLRRHQLPQGQGAGLLAPGQGYNSSIQ